VWVTADIYEEQLPLLKQLAGQAIVVRSDAWPGRQFAARVFYTGDLVDEASRTLALRALATNAEGLLKPGMFVNVELPSLTVKGVLQVPLTAVQNYEGKTFVFVHQGGEAFVRRDVRLGRRSAEGVEVLEGVQQGDNVVTSGGFALKSQMLADLVSE
jgi:membrane fusion protein, heavy metal efflux system